MRRRGRRRVTVLVKGAVALSVITMMAANVIGGGGGAETANLWVQSGGGTCARHSTPVAFASATSGTDSLCGAFNTAYQAAQNSDLIYVKAGAYTSQAMTANTGLSGANSAAPLSTDVTIKAASGETVTWGGSLAAGSYHVIFDGFSGSDWIEPNDRTVSNFHLRNIDFVPPATPYALYFGSGTSYASLQNSDIGPAFFPCGNPYSAKLIQIWGANNLLLEGNTIHGMSAETGCGIHPDAIESCGFDAGCSSFPTVHDITLRGNRFYDNECDNGRFGGASDFGWLVENNFFGVVTSFEGGCDTELALEAPGAVIRYNTFDGGLQHCGGCTAASEADRLVYGNIFNEVATCPDGTGTVAEYNVWLTGGSTTCGGAANKLVASMSGWFTNTATGDLHLTGSATAALGAGNPSVFPTTDYDGQSRANPPDAGADEVP